MKKISDICIFLLTACTVHAAPQVDFNKIQHWTGEGENEAALVVQFNDGTEPRAYVWGYRWDGYASGEDLVRAVARASRSLTVLIQYTGSMGYTLDGVGLSKNRSLTDCLYFDFDEAKDAVSFDYFNPNTMMGQTGAPGWDTPDMCAAAIEKSRTTGIIDHPINARRYGYPAYDYDCWKVDTDSKYYDPALTCWQAGWYDGYWSYWVGTADSEPTYSGLGMSSRVLENGSVDWWSYNPEMTAQDPAENLDYLLEEYAEEMTEPAPYEYAVDFGSIGTWVGNGEKFAAVVVQFNDGKTPANLVYGYRWSGGWDNRASEVVNAVLASDSRFTVERDGTVIRAISYDSDGDGSISDSEHQYVTGNWNLYASYTDSDGFEKVSDGTFVNPRTVLVLSCNKDGDDSMPDLSYCAESEMHRGKVETHADGTISISGCEGYEFTVISTSGSPVASFSCLEGSMTVRPVNTPGIYILYGVSNGNTIIKKYLIR